VRPSAIDPVTIGSIYEDAHSVAQENMLKLALRLRGFPHRTYVRHGKVSDVISEIIRENEIDLLVAGTHGRTGLGKLLLGSVADCLPCNEQTRYPGLVWKLLVRRGRQGSKSSLQ